MKAQTRCCYLYDDQISVSSDSEDESDDGTFGCRRWFSSKQNRRRRKPRSNLLPNFLVRAFRGCVFGSESPQFRGAFSPKVKKVALAEKRRQDRKENAGKRGQKWSEKRHSQFTNKQLQNKMDNYVEEGLSRSFTGWDRKPLVPSTCAGDLRKV